MGGYLFWVEHQQELLKKEMRMRLRAGINRDLQDEFEITLKEGKPADPSFRWEEEKEFSYKGKMYDVIDKQIVDGKLRIRCIEDSKEEELLKKLADIQEKEGKKGDKSRAILLLLTTFTIRTEITSTPNVEDIPCSYYEHYLSAITSAEKEVVTPPPRC